MSNSGNRVIRYSLSVRILHWGMAALVFSMLFAGLLMVRSLEPWQPTLLSMHKSFGIIAFVAVVFRVVVRLMSAAPSLPAGLSGLQRLIARGSHLLLYVAMIVLPVSGYLMQNAAGRPLTFFGQFAMPPVLPTSLDTYGLLREVHGLMALGLMGLVLLHIAGALYHGWVRKDGVLQTMLSYRRDQH
ncbi:cytochrome b [Microbulbifer sp. YPW1]|uniref:cytochrome b n=1 Tax=Microbulbifer sp. YPW1 TaxID=2745199 RepID=UPI0015978F69|nr:cytochrome b [Microbulbifer sp. YPW1]QKX17589.1 cytochrome b [Microbulbifer sp. YPW1]